MDERIAGLLGGGQSGLMGLLGSPMFQTGMGLLAARHDGRINPYGAAMGGMMDAAQFRQLEQDRKREQEEIERQQKAREAAAKILESQFGVQPVEMGPPTPDGQMNTEMRPDPFGQLLAETVRSDGIGAAADLMSLMNGTGGDVPAGIQTFEHLNIVAQEDSPRGRAARIRLGLEQEQSPLAPIGVPRVVAGENGQYRMVQPIWNPNTRSTELQDIGPAPQEPAPGMTERLLEDQVAYRDATMAADSAARLADEFEANIDRIPAGLAASTSEYFKQVFGSEDALSELRRRQREIQVKMFTANLPPGVSSDKDVEIARDPIPKDFANPAQVVAYMRAQSLGNRKVAEFLRFRENYLMQNRFNPGGLLDAWDDHQKSLSWWSGSNDGQPKNKLREKYGLDQ